MDERVSCSRSGLRLSCTGVPPLPVGGRLLNPDGSRFHGVRPKILPTSARCREICRCHLDPVVSNAFCTSCQGATAWHHVQEVARLRRHECRQSNTVETVTKRNIHVHNERIRYTYSHTSSQTVNRSGGAVLNQLGRL